MSVHDNAHPVSTHKGTLQSPVRTIHNLLYDEPELYEVLYPRSNGEVCVRACEKFSASRPESVLDIGCGTGRDLRSLRRHYPVRIGVDRLPKMIQYAQRHSTGEIFTVGDMRTVRLDRSFDVILCMGSTLMYCLSNSDIDRALNTFKAHSHPGTLLILDMHNCSAFLGNQRRKRITRRVREVALAGTYTVVQSFDIPRQIMMRSRTWQVKGQSYGHDYFEYRMFFPQEIECLLRNQGYRVVGMYDNKKLADSRLRGDVLYTCALYDPV